MITSIMNRQVFFILLNFEQLLFFFKEMSSSIPMLLVILFAHVGKCSNSRSQIFFKTSVPRNFAIFTGKNLCWSLFLIMFQDWRPVFLFKKRLQRRYFTVNIAIFFKNSFFIEDLFIYFSEILIGWQIIDILELYFTTVKLGHVIEKTP